MLMEVLIMNTIIGLENDVDTSKKLFPDEKKLYA